MKLRWPTVVAANASVLAPGVVAALLRAFRTDTYSRAVQEDQALEWATFWAFAMAAAFYLVTAVRLRRAGLGVPWFTTGLALFCVFVAMEEISWGQRVLGYRPPDYFLEQNFQQELNVHNVFSTGLRKLVLKGVILGFGVVLPLLAAGKRGKAVLDRLGVPAPPWQLAPAFLATYLLYEIYPWSHTGEWVELMLGFGFLLAAVSSIGRAQPSGSEPRLQVVQVLASVLAPILLGLGTTAVLDAARSENPELLATAQREVEALRQDFLSGRIESNCSLHKRLYTFMEKYDQRALLEGEFASLVARGLPEARAEFLLDPWNSPYWIRDWCKDGRRLTFVYSFGPDRKRDSTRDRILGDDIGAFIRP
jgi:hypothetical protein